MKLKLEVKYNKKNKEHYIILPKELLSTLNWKTGDKIEWIDNKDGSFSLRKVEYELV